MRWQPTPRWASATPRRCMPLRRLREYPVGNEEGFMGYSQWATNDDGAAYTAAGKTVGELVPGYYDLSSANGQVFFVPVHARTDELLEFPDSASEQVIQGIGDFW